MRGKHDTADVEAIRETVAPPAMRFVGLKSPDQKATKMLYRTRKILTRPSASGS